MFSNNKTLISKCIYKTLSDFVNSILYGKSWIQIFENRKTFAKEHFSWWSPRFLKNENKQVEDTFTNAKSIELEFPTKSLSFFGK